MTGDAPFSPAVQEQQPTPNVHVAIDEASHNSDQLLDADGSGLVIESNDLGIEVNDLELEDNDAELEGNKRGLHSNDPESDCERLLDIDGDDKQDNRVDTLITTGENGNAENQGGNCPPPAVGLEFDSYDNAYNYYNCYARELGFAIRVKSSWTKRNSKEKRGAVLCCNCEGFKTVKDVNSRRKETRTGCLAMIRLRLVESKKWRVDEVKLEHNHSFDRERAQNSKSHKKMDASSKRKVEPTVDIEVKTIKLYRRSAVDQTSNGPPTFGEEVNAESLRRLKLKPGDAAVMHDYFSRVQLTNPNFLYLIDLSDDGCLRNVFWMESRSRAAYSYFSDVVAFDTTCLSDEYEIPLLVILGVNHHGKSVLLGCGLLADQTFETYVWLFRAWLTCIAGRPPQTIITSQCKAMQSAIAEVFPRTRHHLHLSNVMQSILHNAVGLQDTESFHMALTDIVYGCHKIEEFETAWEGMLLRFGLANLETFSALYDDRERWVPVYLKDKISSGILTSQEGQCMTHFFDGLVKRNTSLKEFFDMYEAVLGNRYKEEALDDFESRNSFPALKTGYSYELQLSKLYTNEIFRRFQEEVVMMSTCISIAPAHMNGSVTTYVVKEREDEINMNPKEARSFEVLFDKSRTELRCICGCFNFKGYLCRHALCILNYNGVEEIPFQYILSRWRKDLKRLYLPDFGSNSIDITNPVQWFDHLYKKVMHVVEEGMKSQDHYTIASQAFKESLNKLLVAEKKLYDQL